MSNSRRFRDGVNYKKKQSESLDSFFDVRLGQMVLDLQILILYRILCIYHSIDVKL